MYDRTIKARFIWPGGPLAEFVIKAVAQIAGGAEGKWSGHILGSEAL